MKNIIDKNNNDIFLHIRLTDAKEWNPGIDYYIYWF